MALMNIQSDTMVEASHSGTHIFDPNLVLADIAGGYEEIVTAQTPDANQVEFRFEGPLNEASATVVDTQNIYLELEGSLSAAPTAGKVPTTVNQLMHSLWSNVEVLMQGTQVSTANGLYAHKAMVETDLSHPSQCKEGLLGCIGYEFEENPNEVTSAAFTNRTDKLTDGAKIHLFGALSIDVFGTEKFLLPGVETTVKLTRCGKEFIMIETGDVDKGLTFKIDKARLHVRMLTLKQDRWLAIASSMRKGLQARYNYSENLLKSYSISKGSVEATFDDIFNRQPVSKLYIAMNLERNFMGEVGSNPFCYRKFGLSKVTIKRESQAIAGTPLSLQASNVRAYHNTLKTLNVAHFGNGITLHNFDHHFILGFTLTADARVNDSTIRPELTGGRVSVSLEFSTPLGDNTRVFVYAERQSTIFINNEKKVTKNQQLMYG